MYSKALKKQFDLTQHQLDNVNTIPYAFGITSPFWGMLASYLGPRLSVVVGGYGITATQTFMYFFATKVFFSAFPDPSDYLLICLLTLTRTLAPERLTCPSLLTAYRLPLLDHPPNNLGLHIGHLLLLHGSCNCHSLLRASPPLPYTSRQGSRTRQMLRWTQRRSGLSTLCSSVRDPW